MACYTGLHVSVKTTAICIVDHGGRIVKDRALATEPESLADWLAGTGLATVRVGLEAGPMSDWLHEGLASKGVPVACVEARHVRQLVDELRIFGEFEGPPTMRAQTARLPVAPHRRRRDAHKLRNHPLRPR